MFYVQLGGLMANRFIPSAQTATVRRLHHSVAQRAVARPGP